VTDDTPLVGRPVAPPRAQPVKLVGCPDVARAWNVSEQRVKELIRGERCYPMPPYVYSDARGHRHFYWTRIPERFPS